LEALEKKKIYVKGLGAVEFIQRMNMKKRDPEKEILRAKQLL
jgi:hypothetical protein